MNRMFERRFLTTLLVAGLAALWSWQAAADTKTAPAGAVEGDHAARMAKGLEIFKTHVRPILTQRCLKCHGGKDVESEFDLTSREGLLKGGSAGPAVLIGNATDSLLFKLINHAKEPHMPHNRPRLPAEEIAHLAAWIDHGAPYDVPLKTAKREEVSWTEKAVTDDARRFWSFQPLKRAEPPAVKNTQWSRTPVDRFILAKLEAAGVEPNPAVDKRQLIRRAYFDLTGLPPAPAEVDAFVNDPAPDAYEKLLDRLLASPRHGERWARHWLDLARFAESHGFEHDYDRPSAYHFRDFVIQALNDDLPYDTFVRWQLAGDEFDPKNNRALTATGFLAAGVHSTQITKNEVEKHRYDEMDDMLATVGTSMLGLTVGCARCHDHKFDPIPQRDYYRMLSTFTTTVRSDFDLNLDAAGHRKMKEAFDRQHAPFVAALEKFESEQLPARALEWAKNWAAQEERYLWITLEPAALKSDKGVKFKNLEDGSYLAEGENPDVDTYTFTAHTDLVGITAVRLEALAHPALAKNGPGRAKDGNFSLGDFRVTIAPKNGADKPAEVKLKNPRASVEQKGKPIRLAIDKDPKSAWSIGPQFGKDHAAAFETETALGKEGGSVLTVTLAFKTHPWNTIGRLRLSVATVQGPVDLRAAAVSQEALGFLRAPAEQRTAEQKTAFLKWYRRIDPEWQKLDKKAQEHLGKAPKAPIVKALISSEGLPAVRLHTQGADFFKETYFLRRGDPEQKEGVAGQGFLQVLTNAPDREKRWQEAPPKGWRTSYRRRALANWLTDVDQGAGALLARVMVNRLWQHHLGRGLVGTPSDFGTRGEPPSHPELLDWLAAELIENGWRLKPIHKRIMTSAVYMQGPHIDPAKAKIDGDNRLYWRRPRQRLEAEVIRDSLLTVSGSLDEKMFGPGTLDPASKRRSIYFTVKRSKLMTMMQVFDAPEALGGVGDRPTTTIAPQALLLMNNPNIRNDARGFAKRIAPDVKTTVEDAVRAGYRIALARVPDARELADAAAFIQGQMASYQSAGKADGREAALTDFCQTLMCLNEFVYVD